MTMPKMFIVVVASVVLLFVAAPAGALVTFSDVTSGHYSYTPGTYFSVGSSSDVASPWDWSLVPFSNPPPAIDNGPITEGVFEESAEFTPYGSNDPFERNLGSLNIVAKDGGVDYGTPSQGIDWAPVYAFVDPHRQIRVVDRHDHEYSRDASGSVPPVPEPGTLVLFGLILVGGSVFRKWR
jgi:hypothetical protein